MALKARYSPLIKPSFENVYHAFTNLSARDQFIATIVGVALLVIVVILPLSYISGKVSGLKKDLSRSHTKLSDVLAKVSDYQVLQQEVTRLEKRFARGVSSMSATIESLVKQADLEPSIALLKEKPVIPGDRFLEKPVELKLTNATLKRLVDLIYKIESYPTAILRVRNLQLKPRFSNRAFFNVTLDIASVQLQEGEEA